MRPINPEEVAQLAGAVEEPLEVPAGGPVLEVELDLAQPEARPDGVDGHPDLHPVAAGEGQGRAQHLDPHRALAGDRRLGLGTAEAADRPAGEAEGEAEAAAYPAAETGNGEVALSPAYRSHQR